MRMAGAPWPASSVRRPRVNDFGLRRDKTLSFGDGFAQVTEQKKGFLLRPALLVLEDGSVFHGKSIGAEGEICW